jgi:hypothetical protein
MPRGLKVIIRLWFELGKWMLGGCYNEFSRKYIRILFAEAPNRRQNTPSVFQICDRSKYWRYIKLWNATVFTGAM